MTYSLIPYDYQYRSFESTYLFKAKNEDEISLKILDLSQKCLFKKKFSSQDLSLLVINQLLEKGHFIDALERLVDKNLLPQKYLTSKRRKVTKKTCEKLLDQMIEQFKPRVFVESKEIEKFTCPITLEIFREPVIDEQGHTFEKSAIESSLQRKNECPLGRHPIQSLVPNRLVKQTIEDWQQKDPIPTFSLFQKENPKLATTNLQAAQTYTEEKEYNEALECYAKAFRYTKNISDYTAIPLLFEKIGQYDKATLAYLYLAKYHLQAGQTHKAIQTLEMCQKRNSSSSLQNSTALIELYYHTGQTKKAFTLSIQTADKLSRENSPEQAVNLYKNVLRDHPQELSLYSKLAALLKDPREKVQVLLKGALQAFQENNEAMAKKLIKQAEHDFEDSLIDHLVFLDFIKKKGQLPQLKQKLLYLAQTFERKELIEEQLSTYKMLFQLEKKPEYCQKILSIYQVIESFQKEIKWSMTYLSLLIEEKKWEQAEAFTQEILSKTTEFKQTLFFYEKLEEIYTHWHGHKLQDLWPKLGKAYQETQELEAAEKTYRKAFERFHRFEDTIALADIFKQSGKTRESVHAYYEAAVQAVLEQNIHGLSLCSREIKVIDPHLNHLDPNQRMHLLTQEHILKLSDQLETTRQELRYMKRLKAFDLISKIEDFNAPSLQIETAIDTLKQLTDNSLRQELPIENALFKVLESSSCDEFAKSAALDFLAEVSEGSVSIEKKRRLRLLSTKSSMLSLSEKMSTLLINKNSFLDEAFGRNDWETYFGVLETIPPLPSHIEKILKSACPFYKGSLIGETHLLVLVPQKVNGEFLTLNRFAELLNHSKKAKGGGAKHKDGNASPKTSYWMLMTKDVIPLSLNTHGTEKVRLLSKYQNPPYKLPTALEAAIGISMYYARHEERIYNYHTMCTQDGMNPTLAIGGSSGGGYYCHELKDSLVSVGITGVLRL